MNVEKEYKRLSDEKVEVNEQYSWGITIEYIVEYNVVKIGINNTAAGIINLNF
jgi:hypothetical protein